MLSDGTPGHFIFQQYHSLILSHGPLVLPLVHRRQAGARWGVRVPSLINKAMIYHRVRQIHRATTVKISRPVSVGSLERVPPPPIENARRVELMIPMVSASDSMQDSGFYPDVPGRPMIPPVDYRAFERHYRHWTPPDAFT